ncbi:MAG TPA: hypothetical protein VGJ34_01915, partial [Gaiellaceae bacterium]
MLASNDISIAWGMPILRDSPARIEVVALPTVAAVFFAASQLALVLLAPRDERLADRVEERDDEVLLPLVAPGAELHREDALRVELVLDGSHERRLAGAPSAEDSNRELRLAARDDLRERARRVRKAERRATRGDVQEDPV